MNIEDIKIGKSYHIAFKGRETTHIRTVEGITDQHGLVVLKENWHSYSSMVFPSQVLCEASKPWYQFWK